MTELPEDFKSNESSRQRDELVVDHAYIERLRELKLELEKTRSQASAARLDARAAELELRIQRLGGRIEESENSLSAGNSTSGERIELRLDQPEQRDRAAEPMLNQEQRAQHEAASESYYAPSLPRHRPRRSAQVFRRVAERNVRLDAAHEVAI